MVEGPGIEHGSDKQSAQRFRGHDGMRRVLLPGSGVQECTMAWYKLVIGLVEILRTSRQRAKPHQGRTKQGTFLVTTLAEIQTGL